MIKRIIKEGNLLQELKLTSSVNNLQLVVNGTIIFNRTYSDIDKAFSDMKNAIINIANNYR